MRQRRWGQRVRGRGSRETESPGPGRMAGGGHRAGRGHDRAHARGRRAAGGGLHQYLWWNDDGWSFRKFGSNASITRST